jgi:hypothetical protein
MNLRSKLARIAALLFSLTLLAGYVVYSHVTPNVPPPDPFGLNGLELTLEPEVVEFDGFVNYGSPVPALNEVDGAASTIPVHRPPQELRIISSKVINQPVFSVMRIRLPWETTRSSWSRRQGDPFADKPDVVYEGYGIKLKGFVRK